jgi:hypothetical protein
MLQREREREERKREREREATYHIKPNEDPPIVQI